MLQKKIKDSFLTFYREDPIKFPPTYKMSTDSEEYNNERIPGWTDRIFNRKGRISQQYYSSLRFILGSDHRPVVASYNLST